MRASTENMVHFLTGAAMCNMFVCIVVIRVQCNKQIKFYFCVFV